MANMTQLNPMQGMDDLFRGLFVRPFRFDADDELQLRLKLDISRADDTYTVKAEMPGVAKDDIHVTIDGNLVTISGEVRKEKEEKKGEVVIHSERHYGAVSRSFTLPQEVDEARAVAKSANGVLTLTLPLKAGSSARRIAVS